MHLLFRARASMVRGACIALAFGSAAATRAAAQSPTAATDIAAIGRVAADFSQRYLRGDAKGMADLYTANGVIFPGGRPMIKGREAIAAYWTLAPGVTIVEHKTTADSVIVVGNTAYDYGTFIARSSRDGQVGNPGYGKYVIVWQRQSDGRWLMHLDIWNASPAPQG